MPLVIPKTKIVLILLAVSLFYRPVGIFFVPGLLLFFLTEKKLMEPLTLSVTTSLAYWIVGAWWIKDVIGLTTFFYATLAMTVIILILLSYYSREKQKLSISKQEIAVLGLFLLIAGLRLYPMTQMIVAPGPGDSSEHAYPTRLIIENNGIPKSYRPLLPIDYFGSYPAGFHTISALISLVKPDIALYRATFFVSSITYVLIQLALFVFLSRFFSLWISFLSSFFGLFFTTYPQLIYHWGGNPTALSFYFGIVGVYLLYELHIAAKWWQWGITAMILVSALLTHANPAMTIFYAYMPLFFFYHLQKNTKQTLKNTTYLMLLAFILLAPYLLNFEMGLSENELAELKQKPTDHAVWMNGIGTLNYLLYVPFQLIGYTSIPFVIISALGIFLVPRHLWKYVGLFLVGEAIILYNALAGILPLTVSLMPDRMTLIALIPLSICVASLFSKLSRKVVSCIISILFITGYFVYGSSDNFAFSTSPYNTDRTGMTVNGIVKIAFFQAFAGPAHLFVFGMKEDSWVTEADLEAFRWIEKNTPQDALFFNMPGTGVWIPALAYREVVLPHVPLNYHTEVFTEFNLTPFIKCDMDYSTPHTCEFNETLFLFDKNNLLKRNINYIYYNAHDENSISYLNELQLVYNKSNIIVRRIKNE